ncbi:hypothetical protein [Niveispirillum fermenti]|uniref:hypothetical protein n=1 Tax=Niveispirillum fermenti TaxID=1233113 RepID=UPI003A8C690A
MSLRHGVSMPPATAAECRKDLPIMLQPLLPWWRALPREGLMPLWTGELVFDLKPWLAYLLMARFPRDGRPPRYTLYGTELVAFAGRDLTGLDLYDSGDVPGFRETGDSYITARTTGRPHWSRVRVDLPGALKVRYDRLLLPFACLDGDARVLGAIRFDQHLPRLWESDDMALTIEQEALLA